MTSEHVRLDGGRVVGGRGCRFFISVWVDGAYMVLEETPLYDAALMKAHRAANNWGGVPVVDEVAQ